MRTIVAGGPVFYADIEKASSADLRRGEVVAFPLALIALVLVFGSLVAAVTPIVIGGFSVIAILASLFLLGHVTDLSIFVLNLATMLGLGLAVDYSLFITWRFREELARRPAADAVAVTVATAGRAIFFSGLTVLIGLGGLTIFPFMFLRSVGIAGLIVVFFSVAGGADTAAGAARLARPAHQRFLDHSLPHARRRRDRSRTPGTDWRSR